MKTIFQIANQLTGDIWKPEYGNTLSDIENAEKRLGIKLPQTLKEFYLAAGNLPQITSSFEYFDKLNELNIEDNKLLFLTENQGTCRWAIDLSTNKVWMKAREWQEDEVDIDTFIRTIMYYNCAEAGYPYGACLEPYVFTKLKETLDNNWEKVSNYDGLYIYAYKDNLIWFFGKDGVPGQLNSIFLSCRRRDSFNQLCSLLGFVPI